MRSVKNLKGLTCAFYGCEIPNGKREDPGDEIVLFPCLRIFTSGFACAGNILVSNDYVSMRKQRPACKRKWNKVLLEKSFKIERHVMNRQRLKSR